MTPNEYKQNAAAMLAFADGKPIEFRFPGSNEWQECYNLKKIDTVPHRPKPEPVTRPWSKPDDVPLLCWILGLDGCASLVLQVANEGVGIATSTGANRCVYWEELNEKKYSTDRKTWKPCTVTEE